MALNTSGSAAPIPTVSATTYTVTVKVLDTAQLVFLKESNYAVRLGTPPKAEAYVEGITSLELTTPAETGGNPNKPSINYSFIPPVYLCTRMSTYLVLL